MANIKIHNTGGDLYNRTPYRGLGAWACLAACGIAVPIGILLTLFIGIKTGDARHPINALILGGISVTALISAWRIARSGRYRTNEECAEWFREAVDGEREDTGSLWKIINALDLTGMIMICGDPIEEAEKTRIGGGRNSIPCNSSPPMTY